MANPSLALPYVSYQNSFVSVVVPVFNEADRIIPNLNLLISEIEPHFSKFEILVVSDGSTDETNQRLLDYEHPNVRIIINHENRGKGFSIRSGFQASRGEFIFFIDGGMELHPRELRIFFGLMALYDADMVIGSKRHPQSNVYYPWYRRLLSRLFQILIRYLFEINVTDTQVGVKLFRKQVIQAILPYLEIDRYGFDLECLSLASRMGYRKVLEAPIRLDYFNKSRPVAVDLFHVLRVGLSLISDTLALHQKMKRLKEGEKVETP